MNRAEKASQIETMVDWLSKSQVAVCADYRGLSVHKITELRRELRKAGSFGKVVKNTLARISVSKVMADEKKEQVDQFITTLTGPTLMVFSFSDPIAPTKVLAKFAKDNEKFTVKGAWLEGSFVNPNGVTELSKMPGRDEIFSMLLSLLSAPATRLARVVNEPGAQIARVIEAHRKKLEGAAA